MSMGTRKKWRFRGMWVALPCGCGFAGRGGLRRGHGGEDRGNVIGPRVGGRWLGGPGRDLAARRADPAGSGGRGRRGAAVSALWVWLGWAPAMREGVLVGVRGGEQFTWAALGGRGVRPGVSGVCAGGVCGSLGEMGVPRRVGLLGAGVCGLRVRGAVRGVRREGLWQGCVVVWAVWGGPCRGARGCARWYVCVGHRVWSGEGGAGSGVAWGDVGLGLRVWCRCMCPLAAARLCGHLYVSYFEGKLAIFCGRGKDFADVCAILGNLLVGGG